MRRSRSFVLSVFAVSSLVACAGGGDGGCSACGAAPIPGGFPRDKAIEGAGALRLTRPGLDLVANGIPNMAASMMGSGDGVFRFDIPTTTTTINISSLLGDVDITVCEDGPGGTPPRCQASANIGQANLRVDAVTPNKVRLSGTIPLSLSDTRTRLKKVVTIRASLAYSANTDCNGGNVREITPHNLPFSVEIPLVAETTPPRNGYTKLDMDNAVIDLSGISRDQVALCMNCGFASRVCNGAADWVKGFVVDRIKGALGDQLKSMLGGALCTAPSPTTDPPCPTGSQPNSDGTRCMYTANSDRCVPMLLGTGAHVELGQLLRSFSPATKGALDFGFAAGGDVQAFPNLGADNEGYPGHTPNGLTLSMVGGVIPSPESECVKPEALQLPTGIPLPDELKDDQVPGYGDGQTKHDMALALSERFLNFSLKSAYNSGLLCLGMSSNEVSMLHSGVLSLLLPSLNQLTFDRKSASAAITTRPGQAPELTLGGGSDINSDPLVRIDLPKFALDFYVWAYDRYIRVLTYSADVSIPINLNTAVTEAQPNGGIALQMGGVTITNGKVENSELLLEKPEEVASSLSQVIGSMASQFLGSGMAPFDVSGLTASFGYSLKVPDGGIRRLVKESDQFLGLFANLEPAAQTPQAPTPRVTLQQLIVDPSAMTLEGYRADARPELHLQIEAQPGLEYAYRIDRGALSAWSSEPPTVVRAPELFLQGKHELRVYARTPGSLISQSEAAVVPFVIDALAPSVSLRARGNKLQLQAWDLISEDEALLARVRREGQPDGAWMPLASLELPSADESFELDVKDEQGNVATVQQGLVRGGRDSTLPSDGGCSGCNSRGESEPSQALWLLGLAAGYALWRRRKQPGATRKRSLPLTTACAATAATLLMPACSCSDDPDGDPVAKTGCGEDCNQECFSGLPKGIIGAYTSVAKASDGTLWVAGYNDAMLQDESSANYGDLVVGPYDAVRGEVAWETIDGLPTRSDDSCPHYDPKGWRKGETDAGPNVGLWTSIVLQNDQPRVSYYDATNKSLKFAARDADGSWAIHTIASQANANIGRYAKMILDGDKPTIAFLRTEPSTGGAIRSVIQLAQARHANPRSASDWNLREIASWDDNPCTGDSCGNDQVCVEADGKCAPRATGCTPADCGTGSSACTRVDGAASCVAVRQSGAVESIPNVVGSYLSLAKGPSGLALLAYDRVRGNLLAFRESGGSFQSRILDGERGSRADGTAVDTGDAGIAATLHIDDSGTWHIAYVEGLEEQLRYMTLSPSGDASPFEIVDDGYGLTPGQRFADGKHLVGDDAALRVEGGNVTLYYQDATAGTLRMARRNADGTWTRREHGEDNRLGGMFPRPIPGTRQVTQFYRETDISARAMRGDVDVVDE